MTTRTKALAARLLKQKTIDISDIVSVRDYLENDSLLHHEVATALEALGEPVALNIKRLEWDGYEATSPVGGYRVQRLGDKWEPLHNGHYMLPRRHGVVDAFATIDEAKTFVQADFERRIRPFIISTPVELKAPDGWRLVPEAALDWLFGEGPDPAGLWFGDFPDDHPPSGAFWWRKNFRAMLAAAPLPASPDQEQKP